jgi:hypothetical protein
MPLVKGSEGIAAKQEEQPYLCPKPLSKLPQRIDGVGGRGAVQFGVAGDEGRVVLAGKLYHLKALFGGSVVFALLEGLMGAGDEVHPLNAQHRPRLLRKGEVAIVDRVERPPKQPNRHLYLGFLWRLNALLRWL